VCCNPATISQFTAVETAFVLAMRISRVQNRVHAVNLIRLELTPATGAPLLAAWFVQRMHLPSSSDEFAIAAFRTRIDDVAPPARVCRSPG